MDCVTFIRYLILCCCEPSITLTTMFAFLQRVSSCHSIKIFCFHHVVSHNIYMLYYRWCLVNSATFKDLLDTITPSISFCSSSFLSHKSIFIQYQFLLCFHFASTVRCSAANFHNLKNTTAWGDVCIHFS